MPAMQLGFDARTPYAVLDREHQLLRQGLARLRAALVPGEPAPPRLLGHHLGGVRDSLAAHFAFTENYGSLHYLVATSPKLQPRLERLHAEHGEILDQLDLVQSRLERGLPLTEVEPTLSSLLDRLADHVLEQRQLTRLALLGGARRRPPQLTPRPGYESAGAGSPDPA